MKINVNDTNYSVKTRKLTLDDIKRGEVFQYKRKDCIDSWSNTFLMLSSNLEGNGQIIALNGNYLTWISDRDVQCRVFKNVELNLSEPVMEVEV